MSVDEPSPPPFDEPSPPPSPLTPEQIKKKMALDTASRSRQAAPGTAPDTALGLPSSGHVTVDATDLEREIVLSCAGAVVGADVTLTISRSTGLPIGLAYGGVERLAG